MKENIEELEELFFEQNLEYGEDKDTIRNNLVLCEKVYQKAYDDVVQLSELLEDGLCYDVSYAVLSIQMLAISSNFIEKFQGMLENYTS